MTAERRDEHVRPTAGPAAGGRARLAGARPVADFAAYLPYVVLAEVLTDGDASRLVERLVQRDRVVTSVGGYIGFMGEPFDVRDPTALLLQAHLPPGGDVDKVLRTIDEEVDRLATDGLTAGELARTQARHAPRTCCATPTRCSAGRCAMAVLEQQRGRAELLNDLPRAGRRGHRGAGRPPPPRPLSARRAGPRVEVVAGRRPMSPTASVRAARGARPRPNRASSRLPTAPSGRCPTA